MEAIPETLTALARLARSGNTVVAGTLAKLGEEVPAVVSDIVGVSLGLCLDQFTFTLVANNELVLDLDAVQYVDDGPCVAAGRDGETIATTPDDLLDESRWQMFARSLAIHGVQSTLSLPVLDHGRVIATVNLYASTADAFVGHHEELAVICHAWAPGIIANADLTFDTLLEAAETPDRIDRQDIVDKAVAMLSQAQHITISEAAARVRDAASRAGISESQAARSIIGALTNNAAD